MPAKKQAATVTRLAPQDHLPKRAPSKRATPPRSGMPTEIVDFDAEIAIADKARVGKKFRIGGFDYSLGKGPNPWQLQQLGQADGDTPFDVTEFLGSYIIPSQRKRFLEHVRHADYDTSDFQLLQKRIMEASAGRPIEAS